MNVGSPYWLYMAEAEGMTDLVTTDTAKINYVIKKAKEYLKTHNQIPLSMLCSIGNEVGLDLFASSDILPKIEREL